MIAEETFLVQFIGGGSPLSGAERQQCVQIVLMAMREAPQQWMAAYTNEKNAVAKIEMHDPVVTARWRESSRYAYAFPQDPAGPLAKEFALEKRIIEAHDPVIAIDPARKLVVTEAMLPALRTASVWIAGAFHVDPPNAEFATALREYLRKLPTLEAAEAEGFGHIESNQPYLAPYWAKVVAPTRAKFFVDNKGYLADMRTPGGVDYSEARAAAVISRFTAKHPGGPAGSNSTEQGQAYSMRMQNNIMGNAARSLSPGCNPTLSASARAGNNCTAPAPVPGTPF